MILCFPKSRMTLAGGCVVTLAVAIAVFATRRTQPLWLICVTLLLLLLLGAMFSRLLAAMVAAREHQKLLAVLYTELDPPRFLQRYERVPFKRNGTVRGMMYAVYLADGLCAAGRYDEALAVLNSCSIPDHASNALALECLLCNSKCHCMLQKGDAAASSAEMRQYDGLLECAGRENPKLAKNLALEYAAFWQELCFLQGKPVDLKAVQTAAASAPVLLRRLELTLLQARVYAQSADARQAAACYEIVLAAGDKLAVSRKAQNELRCAG